jgi:hypothetical protein
MLWNSLYFHTCSTLVFVSRCHEKVCSRNEGDLIVHPRLMTPNCKQLQPGLIRHMTLVLRMYVKYMCSQTPRMRSACVWTRLITLANPPP